MAKKRSAKPKDLFAELKKQVEVLQNIQARIEAEADSAAQNAIDEYFSEVGVQLVVNQKGWYICLHDGIYQAKERRFPLVTIFKDLIEIESEYSVEELKSLSKYLETEAKKISKLAEKRTLDETSQALPV